MRSDGQFKYVDISDEVHLFYEIELKLNSLSFQNVEIALINKKTDSEIDKINFGEKNVVKVVNSKIELADIDNMNKRYELVWTIKENNRNGIIQYDFPIILKASLLA